MRRRILQRSFTITGCLVMIALAIGPWPRPASADVTAMVLLADSNESWSRGFFARTGLAASSVGGVQLVPIKVTTAWSPSANLLPIKLRSHASAVYGDRIFVVGGNTLDAGNSPIKSRAFLSTRLAAATGEIEPWIWQGSSPGLPQLPEEVADPSAVVVQVGGKPYLFVLGGRRGYTATGGGGNFDDVTTAGIYYYPLGAGTLTGQAWAAPKHTSTSLDARLPHEPDYDCYAGCGTRGGGASGMAAVSVTIGSTPYIYLFGGHSVTKFSGGSYVTQYTSAVYRAPVSLANNLPALGQWQQVGDIRNTAGDLITLANAAAVSYPDPRDGSTAVYLIGGETGSRIEENAYIAHITTAGAVVWKPNGNMSDFRTGHGAVQADGQITVVGGTSNGADPTSDMARGYILDDLTLYRDGEMANFELIAVQGQVPHMRHAMASIRSAEGMSLAYILGGQTSTEAATNHVLIGNLNAPATISDKFVPNGKYYSRVFNFGRNAEYLELKWRATMPDETTLQMQFRVGDDPLSLGPLQNVPVTSVSGDNTYTIPTNGGLPISGQYFQLVATFERPVSTNPDLQKITPLLDSISLKVTRDGFPNVRVANNGASFSLESFEPAVTITNKAFIKNGTPLPVVDANWETEGSFFVAIYVTPPGRTPQPPAIGDGGVAYAEVRRSSLPVDAVYSIPNDTAINPTTGMAANPMTWRPSSCSGSCPLVNWRNVFSSAGTYTVYVMVDAINDATLTRGIVIEADVANQDSESDNVFGPFQVQVDREMPRVLLPMVYRIGPSAASMAQPSAPARWMHTLK